MQNTSFCIRCGKKRVEGKSWKEKTNSSVITHTLTVCPDPACQKIVEEQLLKRKEKIALIQEESLKRRKDNIRNRKGKKASDSLHERFQLKI